MSDLLLRPMQGDERAFVRDSWLRSYCAFHQDKERDRDVCMPAKQRHCAPKAIMALHGELVDRLLDNQLVSVAVHPDEPDTVLGWCCHGTRSDGKAVVHYVYVRPSARGPQFNIARQLIAYAASLGDTTFRWIASHETRSFSADRVHAWGGWLDRYSALV